MKQLIADFIQYLKIKKYSNHSIESHQLDLFHFEQWLGEGQVVSKTDVANVALPMLQKYMNDLESRCKPRTVARHLSSLKLFFHFLVQIQAVQYNPMRNIKFPEIEYELPEVLSAKEVIALLEAPPKYHFLGIRDRAMLEFAYSTGAKIEEIINLDVDDLLLEEGVAKIKGKRMRLVPISKKAKECLEVYLNEGSRQYYLKGSASKCLFVSQQSKRLHRVSFWNIVKRHAQTAGITKRINPRILRHSFASHLIEQGMDLTTIRTLFGYVSLDATMQYAHINRPHYDTVFHDKHPRGQNMSQKLKKTAQK